MAPRRFRRLRRLLRIVAVSLLAAGLAEAVLRLAGRVYLDRIYRVEAPRPGDITVLGLGESSTAGLWVSPADSYPRQLESALRQLYALPNIRVVVPPHVGQNTSQIANRIDDYLDRYRPRLVVVMAGYNNEWSLAESHIGRFLAAGDPEERRVRALVALDSLRLFRLFRYGWLRFVARSDPEDQGRNALYVFGHPHLVRYPPEPAVFDFAKRHRDAFVALWRDDVGRVIARARAKGSRVLLMTYHINPTYLGEGEFVALANETGAPLARNDRVFQRFIDEGVLGRYVFPDDMWHPNRLGYSVIAGNVLDAIRDRDLLGLGAPRGTPKPSVVAGGEPLGDALVHRIDLSSQGALPHLGIGWSRAEGDSRWTDGPAAEVLVNLSHPGAVNVLRMELRPFVVPGKLERQRLSVLVNGKRLVTLTLREPLPSVYSVDLRPGVMERDNVLTLELPDARSPASVGVSTDPRVLGIALRWLALEGPTRP